jgi:hypothetical protein
VICLDAAAHANVCVVCTACQPLCLEELRKPLPPCRCRTASTAALESCASLWTGSDPSGVPRGFHPSLGFHFPLCLSVAALTRTFDPRCPARSIIPSVNSDGGGPKAKKLVQLLVGRRDQGG